MGRPSMTKKTQRKRQRHRQNWMRPMGMQRKLKTRMPRQMQQQLKLKPRRRLQSRKRPRLENENGKVIVLLLSQSLLTKTQNTGLKQSLWLKECQDSDAISVIVFCEVKDLYIK